jgi:cbb3-type cytochrome oxidase subunit 3
MQQLQSLFATAWVVWFFLLTVGIVAVVMRPGKRRFYQEQGLIPLRDDLPSGPRAQEH